jgi:DNA polymerase III epsilon subunit-like protein
MQLVKRIVGTKKNLTLADACGIYGLETGNHRADRDVLATCRLLTRIAGPVPGVISHAPIDSV